MSQQSPSPDQQTPRFGEILETAAQTWVEWLVPQSPLSPVRTGGFWLAVALPFLHLPLLLTGLGTVVETVAYLSLLAVNVLALLVGHSKHN